MGTAVWQYLSRIMLLYHIMLRSYLPYYIKYKIPYNQRLVKDMEIYKPPLYTYNIGEMANNSEYTVATVTVHTDH